MSAPDSQDAHAWLAALAARVEDNPALLDALSDAEVDALLQDGDVRPAGVAAAIRRRVREAPAPAPRRPSLWRWAGTVAAVLALAMVWALWPSSLAPEAEAVAEYRAELEQIAGPARKGAERPPLAQAARDLLEAAEAGDPTLAQASAARFALSAETAETPEARAESAFFAALAYDLAGDDDEARLWRSRVPPESRYGSDAAE